ncbi:ABC transporter permease [Nocardia mexicana]|uniref:ABC-2 type transport system permease protein n=1 Tax=Nocardia mexicana TaxID=279262 RepID=A0A370GEW3_9NOCA|nr:ABC transporter permease [Nocardia mexicana]RDI42352.1 ABC-2 type transport system permease protein [Nocardia mexicana]
MGVITAERIKLTSTRSPWWCSASVVVIGLGLAAIFGLVAKASYGKEGMLELTVSMAVSGLTGLGVMILMIMATLTVTSEYRFGIIRTTFQATPNRTRVIATKAGLVAVFGAVLTAVLALLAFGLAKVLSGSDAGAQLTLSSAEDWRGLIGVPVYAFLGAILAVAIGVLVRQSAAAIALIVLWPMLVEPLAGAFGSFGRNVQPFLPFANMQRFIGGADASGNWHWGPWGGLVYFTVFVAIVLAAALYTVEKRDA